MIYVAYAVGAVVYFALTCLTARLIYQSEYHPDYLANLDTFACWLAGLCWPLAIPIWGLLSHQHRFWRFFSWVVGRDE